MKYWAYLAAKLALVGTIMLLLLFLVQQLFPPPPVTRYGKVESLFLWDWSYTFTIFGIWLIGAGLLWLVARDQRDRCRICVRRLVMPVDSGSWGNMLRLGRPRTELICPFGHGTLRIDNLRIAGGEKNDWQAHDDDIWKELESYYK